MKLQKKLFAIGTTLLLTNTLYAQDGASLFDTKCAACHVTSRPSDKSTLVAPPVMGVMRHVKMRYTSKEEAVAFISAYALNPEASKAVCMPQKIKRFGLMPSQKGNVTKEELQTIASWMYDNFPPQGFQGMGRGQGKGQGKGCQTR
ncbi:MAG: cytochrome c [Sulfurovum sp.]|nr:cytochrome c [Sulfurovum sp.]